MRMSVYSQYLLYHTQLTYSSLNSHSSSPAGAKRTRWERAGSWCPTPPRRAATFGYFSRRAFERIVERCVSPAILDVRARTMLEQQRDELVVALRGSHVQASAPVVVRCVDVDAHCDAEPDLFEVPTEGAVAQRRGRTRLINTSSKPSTASACGGLTAFRMR